MDYEKIVYEWGREKGESHLVTTALHEKDPATTVAEMTQDGLNDLLKCFIHKKTAECSAVSP